MKLFLSLIVILMGLIVIPISYYNMYHILKAVGASDLMWFFYWFSFPLAVITSVISKMIEMMKDKF